MTTLLDIITNTAFDPTRTMALQNAFIRDMKRRFNELKSVIVEAIVKQDCLGLNDISTAQLVPPGNRAFSFLRDPQKIEAFMRWLKIQEDRGLISTGTLNQVGFAIERAWTDMYVLDSYKRGIMRARYELRKSRKRIPSLEATGGILASLSLPIHLDRVGVLFTRVFSDLTGITSQMDTIISRILAQGIIEGDGPRLLARKILAAIDGTDIGSLGLTDTLGRYITPQRRAITLARTEIIRAHHLATIQEYRNWGVLGVHVMAEWSTAGDDRVCAECMALEGKIFTLDQIEPMIPLHPNCRCLALPA